MTRAFRSLRARAARLPRRRRSPRRGAASRFTIRGAGFGHGVGMSQYGAYGFAEHGCGLRRDPRATTTRARRSATPTRTATVRVLLQPRRPSARVQRAPRQAGRASSTRRRPTACAAARPAGRPAGRARASGWRRSPPRCRWPGADGCRWRRARTAHGGAYRGALEFRSGAVRRHRRDQRRRRSRLRARRRAAPSARLVAGRGAQGPGGRRAHVRDHDVQGRRRLRPVPRHALAGLRRRRGRDGGHQRGRRRDRRPGRHLRRRAGRHLLLLHLRRAHRERREHVARRASRAVAASRSRTLRQRLAAAPLGPDPDDAGAPPAPSSAGWSRAASAASR